MWGEVDVTMVEVEWGETGGGGDGVVVGKLKERENLVPFLLVGLDKWA